MSKRISKTPVPQLPEKNRTMYKLVSVPSFTGILLLALPIAGIVGLTGFGIADEIKELNYQSDVGHHIQEAFNTVSAPASSEQLGIALQSIEKAGLDHGYTNWIWKSKCGDLSFWHRTLQQAKYDVDRASYEKAWAPEADENVILQRHYRVLKETYGSDLSPCDVHLGEYKWMFDLAWWTFTPGLIIGPTGSVIRAMFRSGMYTVCKLDGSERECVGWEKAYDLPTSIYNKEKSVTAGGLRKWAVRPVSSEADTTEQE